MDLFLLYELKISEMKNVTMKHIKIIPGSKSCNSQQEAKRCFGIRWYVFLQQDLLEVCRIQTSSGEKENDLYNNQINARALIGQSAEGYCAGKPTEKSSVSWIII